MEHREMDVEIVAYGRPAAEALRAAIAEAKGDEPLAPVTVVVPSNHVGVATRRLLASGTLGPVCGRGIGLTAVDFLTVYRLAELVGSPTLAAKGRRPVSTPVIAAAVRAALADDPGRFAPVAHHPATEAALVTAYRELRDLADADLERLGQASPRAGEVVRLQQATRRRLETDWYDEQDLMAAAAAELAGGRVGGGLGTVIVYLPQRLSTPAAELLRAAGVASPLIVLAGGTGDERSDAEVGLTLARLAGASQPGRELAALGDVVGPDRTAVVTTSDGDDEIRAAVRAVVEATRAGTPLDRIAILHAGPGPYGRLAHEHLAAAGIGSNGPSVVALAARLAGRFLLGLLALPEGGFSRRQVLSLIADGRPHVGGRQAPVALWERISRRAGVVGGRADWEQRLDRYAAAQDVRADEQAQTDGRERATERAREDADSARELKAFVVELIDSLDQAAASTQPWDDRATWARDHLQRIGGSDRRTDWPPTERKAAERVEAALDRLAALATVEGPVTMSVFARTLELELESDLGRMGRFGEGVLVGPLSMGIGLDLDLVVVVGLAEGTLPAVVRDDSLLPDSDREAAGDHLALRRSRVDTQHRHFLATLASARRHLLTFPRGDLRRSVERVPSRWLLDVTRALTGERWWSPQLASARAPWLTHIGSFDAGLRRLPFPATAQEHRLRSLLATPDPLEVMAHSPDAVLATGTDMAMARSSGSFTRFDGNLAGVGVPSPVDFVASATGLEHWARCPHAYFQRRILGVDEPDDPEDSLRMTPMERGSLVHRILERFIHEVVTTDPSLTPQPAESWSAVHRARLLELAEAEFEVAEQDGVTGRTIFWRRDREEIRTDLIRFLKTDSAARSRDDATPIAAELHFGFGTGGLGPVQIPLTDGRAVSFHGSADRVDRASDGTIYVIDYKTGKNTGFTTLNEDEPTQSGTRLQLPIYGQAARALLGEPDAPVDARYWFVSKKGDFKRPGYAVTHEVLSRVSADLTGVVQGIESGLFPHHPSRDTKPWVDCVYCDPDGQGVGDLLRQWDAKREDPTMATYADVMEPHTDDAAAVAGDG